MHYATYLLTGIRKIHPYNLNMKKKCLRISETKIKQVPPRQMMIFTAQNTSMKTGFMAGKENNTSYSFLIIISCLRKNGQLYFFTVAPVAPSVNNQTPRVQQDRFHNSYATKIISVRTSSGRYVDILGML